MVAATSWRGVPSVWSASSRPVAISAKAYSAMALTRPARSWKWR